MELSIPSFKTPSDGFVKTRRGFRVEEYLNCGLHFLYICNKSFVNDWTQCCCFERVWETKKIDVRLENLRMLEQNSLGIRSSLSSLYMYLSFSYWKFLSKKGFWNALLGERVFAKYNIRLFDWFNFYFCMIRHVPLHEKEWRNFDMGGMLTSSHSNKRFRF